MIIYGWKSKLIKQAPLENVECEKCHEKNSYIFVHSNYAHIFWIPLFPFAKKALVLCGHCQHVQEEKQMTPEFKGKVKVLKDAVPTPKYMFSGLVIIALFVGYLFFSGNENSRAQENFMESPLVGDIYILKDDEEPTRYKYYLFKLTALEEDSMYFSPNTFQYNKPPHKLDPKDGFYNISIGKTRSQLLELHRNGSLKKIIRKYDNSSGFNRVVELDLDQTDIELAEN